jgi:CDGSH-type Zn-finger protein
MFEPSAPAAFFPRSSAGFSKMPDVSIRTRENGPLLVTGPITLVDPDGNQFNIAGKETVALCRCGQSQNKPFCDGQHKACGFVAGERAVPTPPAPQ